SVNGIEGQASSPQQPQQQQSDPSYEDVELLSVPDPGSLEATTAAATGRSEALTSEQTLKRPKSDTLPIQPNGPASGSARAREIKRKIPTRTSSSENFAFTFFFVFFFFCNLTALR
ncbi:Uncharacterized protein DAT39_022119, partial [Clarias magur]